MSISINTKTFIDDYTEMVLRMAELEDNLQQLCDLQQGPPLIREEEQWNAVMKRSREILFKE